MTFTQNLLAFAIQDTRAGFYHAPFFANSHVSACRTIATTASDPMTLLHKYPEDFTLWCLGTFDSINGELSAYDDLTNLGTVSFILDSYYPSTFIPPSADEKA